MDPMIIAIVVGVVVVVGIVVVLMTSKGAGEPPKPVGAEPPEDKQKVTSKRFTQVMSDDELDGEQKQRHEELLTKYTAGTGEGINEVEKLLASDPNNVDLLDWLAFMYYSNNDTDKAIETYKRALAIKPSNENQHYYLGNSYFKKNMNDEARKEWQEVIRLRPNSKIAKNAQERIDYITNNPKK